MRPRSRAALAAVLTAGAVVGGLVVPTSAAADMHGRQPPPPTIHSDHFVENGGPPGVLGPGEFTFTPNGAGDVISYRWFGDGIARGTVMTDRPGAPATVWIDPTTAGSVTLTVQSMDVAGNTSEPATYRFWLASNAPTTSLADQYHFGERVQVTLTAVQQGAAYIHFVWTPEDLEHIAPIGPDGTVSIVITMPSSGPTAWDFLAWTTHADGPQSQVTRHTVHLVAPTPELAVP